MTEADFIPLGDGYGVYQSEDGFKFGTDAVVLSEFVKLCKGDRICDVGTGTGIIPVLLTKREAGIFITALEIDPVSAEMAQKSVKECGLSNIEVICADAKTYRIPEGAPAFDKMVCNPPYFTDGKKSPCKRRLTARHEDSLTLSDLTEIAKRLLKCGGSLFMVHKPERLSDCICEMRKGRLELKRLCPVCTEKGNPPCLILMEFKKDAKPSVIFEKQKIL